MPAAVVRSRLAGLLRDRVPPPHFVARCGGEEFCAFLGEVEASEGMRIAEGLRARGLAAERRSTSAARRPCFSSRSASVLRPSP